jgi:hypothetical protein
MTVTNSTVASAIALAERVLAEMLLLRRDVATMQAVLAQRQPVSELPMADGPPAFDLAVVPTTGLSATCFGIFTIYRCQTRLPLGRHKAVIDLCRFLVGHAGQLSWHR